MSENSAEFLILSFAVWRAGGVMAVVHAAIESAPLDYALTNAEPHFLFAEKEWRPGAEAAVKRTGMSTQVFDLAIGQEPLGQVTPFTGNLPKVDPSALGVIGYTSGTTGMPKPVAHTHRTVGGGTDLVANLWRFNSEDTVLVAMPLSWLGGLVISSVTATTRGAKIHLLRQITAENALDAIINHGVTFIFNATTMYVKIFNAWRQQNSQGTFRLRCCISGGEPRNEAVFDEWRKVTGTPVLDSYGASELWPFVTHDPANSVLPPRGSGGKLVAGAKMRLLGPDGREVTPGEIGEAQAIAPCMMMCYWKEPELTAQAITPDGWYRTGDVARVDENGYVFVLGRAKDLIVHDGKNVFPSEVEQVLSELDYVAEVAVVGLPDSKHGQAVAAAVIAMPGVKPDEAAIRAHCVARLAGFKVPSMIRIVKDLPHNGSGKVLRRDVIPMLTQMRDAEKTQGGASA